MRGKLWQCFYYAEKVKNKMRGNEKKKKKLNCFVKVNVL